MQGACREAYLGELLRSQAYLPFFGPVETSSFKIL